MKLRHILTNLTTWVIVAIIGGIILGHFNPSLAVTMQPLGTYFINCIKVFINPIIFLTIVLGLSGMGSLKQVGRVGGKALLYFEVVTTAALLIGILVSYLIQPGSGVDISASANADVSLYTSKTKELGIWSFLKTSVTLHVLFFSILFGSIINRFAKADKIKMRLQFASKYVFKALHYLMLLAPIGAFGGMAFTIGKYGLASLLPLAKLMMTVYITMGLFIFLVLGAIMKYYKLSLLNFLNYIKEELLIVLGTSSSESALPSLMEKLENAGCEKSIVGLVVPSGYSFNLDGTSLYLSMAVMFLAQVYNIHLSMTEVLTILGVLMITSKGAAGVTGSGFVVLASTLSAVKVIPIEGLALLLGVDRFMSEARSITNFIGNGVATLVISANEGKLDRVLMDKVMTKEVYEYEEI